MMGKIEGRNNRVSIACFLYECMYGERRVRVTMVVNIQCCHNLRVISFHWGLRCGSIRAILETLTQLHTIQAKLPGFFPRN